MANDRFIAALRNEKVDRVPVVPKIWVDFSARVTNASILDVIQDPLTALRVIALAGKKLGLDAVRQFHFYPRKLLKHDDKIYEINSKGEKIGTIDLEGGLATKLFDKKYFDIRNPEMLAHGNWISPDSVVNNIEDAKAIAVPQKDIFDSFSWGKNQKQIIEEFGGDMEIIGDCDSATMSYYIRFRGIEKALFDLIENPALVHTVMKKGAQTAIAKGKYWLDNGIEVLRLNDSAGNMSLISPQHWKEFVFPYIKTVCSELHNYNKKAIIYCHICGNVLPVIKWLVQTDLDCIAPLDPLGGFTVKQVREQAGNSISLMGGVNTLTLLNGSVQDVKAEALKCMKEAGHGGFILGSGCAVARNTPEENIIALIEASKNYIQEIIK
ncbi:MAG: hypothetical protein A2Y10_17505 [Planctomycetes bacterium GWF2_41_51]|nr:MAG: hypothetical protein A2Y10_17505 [Planctomycetes bacterium GWF2_41_51]HBG28023.1 hypothetical protein [Phycisphaerales bacterium]